MSSLRTLALAACASFSLIAAGCGGDVEEKNAYVSKVNEAQQQFSSQITKLTSSVVGAASANGADKKAVGGYEDAVTEVVDDLKAITPPEEVKAEHGTLVKAMETYAKGLTSSVKKLTTGSPQERLSAATKLQQDSSKAGTDINQAITSINTKLQGS